MTTAWLRETVAPNMLWVVVASAATLTSSGLAQDALRYRLEPGDRIVYERRVRLTPLDRVAPQGPTAGGPQEFREQIQIWCLSGPRAARRVFLDVTRVADGRTQPPVGVVLTVDARGVAQFEDEVVGRLGEVEAALEVLPILPPAVLAEPTWRTEADVYGRSRACTQRGGGEDEGSAVRVDFTLEDLFGVGEISGHEHRGSFWFDAKAGLVSRVETLTIDRPAGTRTESVIRLHARRKQDERSCTLRDQEAERLLNTLRLEDRLLDEVVTKPAAIDTILDRLDRVWGDFLAEPPRDADSPLRRVAAARRERLKTEAAGLREQARLAAEWLGRPAAQWSLQDLDGQTVQSEALRDRYVLECFWSAASVPSLRTFQTLRGLRQAIPEEKLRIVCINVDPDPDAARRAAQRCGQSLPHLLSGPPLGGELPRELPVLRLLDRESRVRWIDFGWRRSLVEPLAPIVQ